MRGSGAQIKMKKEDNNFSWKKPLYKTWAKVPILLNLDETVQLDVISSFYKALRKKMNSKE